jgi:DNA-binding response OmpR family regulator
VAKQKILIVDDEPDLLKLTKIWLEFSGYDVLDLNSGKDVVKTVQEKKPNLVLLDLKLPDTDGYEICKELKRNPDTASIPVIIFTAKSEWIIGIETSAAFVKADDYILKPFEPLDLLVKIRKLLKR